MHKGRESGERPTPDYVLPIPPRENLLVYKPKSIDEEGGELAEQVDNALRDGSFREMVIPQKSQLVFAPSNVAKVSMGKPQAENNKHAFTFENVPYKIQDFDRYLIVESANDKMLFLSTVPFARLKEDGEKLRMEDLAVFAIKANTLRQLYENNIGEPLRNDVKYRDIMTYSNDFEWKVYESLAMIDTILSLKASEIAQWVHPEIARDVVKGSDSVIAKLSDRVSTPDFLIRNALKRLIYQEKPSKKRTISKILTGGLYAEQALWQHTRSSGLI